MFLEINGIKLYVEIYGSNIDEEQYLESDKPVVIALPGGPGFSHSFLKPGLNPISVQYPLIYFDPRGTGKSDLSDKATWSAEQLADDVIALIDSLRIQKPYLYAHSGGALVAATVLQRSDKVSGVICANGIIADKAKAFHNWIKLGGNVAKRTMVDLDLASANDFMLQVVPKYDPIPRPMEHAVTLEGNFEQCLHLMHSFLEPSLLDRLSSCVTPVHFIVSGLDPLNPAEEAIPTLEAIQQDNFTWQVFERSGHDNLLCEPEKTIEVVLKFIYGIERA
jgi:pimeloyl-ACP methyl ester carboxylesterase